MCLQSLYEWSCPWEIVSSYSFFSSAAHPAVTTGFSGDAGWHCWEWHFMCIGGSGRVGVGTQQHVLLYIQHCFALSGWLLLELCTVSTSENEALKVLYQMTVIWDSQDQWMHLFMLLPPRVILVTKLFLWLCHFPLMCLFPCPPCLLGTPTSWYQKSGPADRWPVNSAVWGSCHWWALQTKSPASRYLFWLPKTCFCLIMYVV